MDQFFILSLTAVILTLYLKVHLLHFFFHSQHTLCILSQNATSKIGAKINLFYIQQALGSAFLYKIPIANVKKVLKLYLFTSIKVVQKLFGSRVYRFHFCGGRRQPFCLTHFLPFVQSRRTYTYFVLSFFQPQKKSRQILIFLIVVFYLSANDL